MDVSARFLALWFTVTPLLARADGAASVPKDFAADFYVSYSGCKLTAATFMPVAKGAESVRSVDFKAAGLGCQRTKKKALTCIDADDNTSMVTLELTTSLETADTLVLTSANSAVLVMINLPSRVAIIQTRSFTDTAVAVKMCKGTYVTADELKAAKAREAATTK